jgi:hypothetical protein
VEEAKHHRGVPLMAKAGNKYYFKSFFFFFFFFVDDALSGFSMCLVDN